MPLIISAALVVCGLLTAESCWADIVLPAVCNQFMVSTVVPIYYSVLLALAVLLVEGLFIRRAYRITMIRALVISLAVNTLSSLVGALMGGVLFGNTYYPFSYDNPRLGTYGALIPGYVLTVIIEGIALVAIAPMLLKELKWIEKNPRPAAVWLMAIAMNAISYAIIAAGIYAADILTAGKVFTTPS